MVGVDVCFWALAQNKCARQRGLTGRAWDEKGGTLILWSEFNLTRGRHRCTYTLVYTGIIALQPQVVTVTSLVHRGGSWIVA